MTRFRNSMAGHDIAPRAHPDASLAEPFPVGLQAIARGKGIRAFGMGGKILKEAR